MAVLQLTGFGTMARLGSRQIAQQLAGSGVFGAGGGQTVKAFGPALHRLCLGPDAVKPKVLHQPHRFAGIKPRHMLTPDQRHRRAEPGDMQVDQAAAVVILFRRHIVEQRRRPGIVAAQLVAVAAINPGVILFR